MKKLIGLVLILCSIHVFSWAQLNTPITEQEAVQRAWDVALGQNLRNDSWVDIESSTTRFNGKEWVVLLIPKESEYMGDGDFIMVYLTPDGEFVELNLGY